MKSMRKGERHRETDSCDDEFSLHRTLEKKKIKIVRDYYSSTSESYPKIMCKVMWVLGCKFG